MKIQFYPDINILYIKFSAGVAKEEIEASTGVVVELEEDGHLLSIKIEGAKAAVNFSNLRIIGWPDTEGAGIPTWESGVESPGGLLP